MTMSQPQPTPAPGRAPRHDGLTPERQEEFLTTLAATGCISHAAAAAGISRTALYRLRNSPDGAAFQARWKEALQDAVSELGDAAFSRALKGISEPVWYKGEQIGERVRYDNKLLMFLLRAHDPATYARPPEPRAARTIANPFPDFPRRATAPMPAPAFSPDLASTLSTSPASPNALSERDLELLEMEEAMDDESFHAELRKLRGGPQIPQRLSKRNARRLAAKGRLPAAHAG